MQPLHIPDGFLSPAVALVFWALSAVALGLAARRSEQMLGERQIPLMGVMAAFIFAAQMLNFPVAGGTSGHFLGGALAAMLLGPWAGILVMTAVIAVQALLFQDGGLLAMGANIFNMGVLTALIGYGLYRLGRNWPRWPRLALAGAAAWTSTVASALLTALQLWLSGAAALGVVAPAMLSVHALIGLGEAAITVAALTFIGRARPDLLQPEQSREQGSVAWTWGGLALALGAVLLAPLASAHPDGLERVAHDLGFFGQARNAPYRLLPDYTLPVLGQTPLSTVAAGVLGALTVFGLAFWLGRSLRGGE